MPTEMELTLEQSQQGVSYEVSVDPHGFEGYLKMIIVAAKDVVVPNVVDEPILSSMGGPMAQRVTVSGNISGSHDSATATPVEGSVTESPTDLNKSGLSFLGPTSYAKLVTNESSRKSVNFRTLITLAQNKVDVNVPLESIRAVSERSSYARAMIELRVDVELKGTIVMAMPKLVDVHKNLKNPRQVARGIQVGTKVAFKQLNQVYRPVSDRNKQAIVASKEVNLSNPFDMLNSVEKDDDLGTNQGHSKSAENGPDSNV
ncbi:hypothetical protein Tco_1131135 [Tanacetum coccineum]